MQQDRLLGGNESRSCQAAVPLCVSCLLIRALSRKDVCLSFHYVCFTSFYLFCFFLTEVLRGEMYNKNLM